jgi:HSP20 family protein
MPRFFIPFAADRPGARRPDPLLQLQREIEQLFEEAYRGVPSSAGESGTFISPALDVHRVENGLEINAELPGVSQEGIDLQLEGDLLTIRGEKRKERHDREAHMVERSYGSFQRSVQLPFAPEGDKVKANFSDGVLTIKIPNPGRHAQSRKIKVGAAEGSGSQQTIEGSAREMPKPEKTAWSNGKSSPAYLRTKDLPIREEHRLQNENLLPKSRSHIRQRTG